MLTYFIVDDTPTAVGILYTFVGEDAHHAINVLRIKEGERFALTDGRGHWAHVTAHGIGKREMVCHVDEIGFDKPLTVQFTVIQALPKSDRMRESLELLTEGGVDRIVPWQAERSIGKGDNVEKWKVTLREATKQSRRTYIPEITDVVDLSGVLAEIKQADTAIAFHQESAQKLSDVFNTSAHRICIIIGPEGGLTDGEIQALTSAGAQVALMGRPVLRTAHAGLAALSAVNALLGVW